MSDNGVLQITSHGLLGLLGGSAESLEDLRSDARLAFLREQRVALRRAIAEVPTVTLTAWVDPGKTSCIRYRPISTTLDWMQLRNDGLVPLVSQTLPDTDYVELTAIDHTGAVAEAGCAALTLEQRKLLTKALLSLAFEPRSI